MRTLASLALGVVLLGGATSAAAADRFVSRRGTDVDNDCLLSTAPCRTMEWAAAQAAGGDTIKVAAGRYKDKIFVGASTVLTLSGGWAEDFTSRDPRNTPTEFRQRRDIFLGVRAQIVVGSFAPTSETIDLTVDGIVFKKNKSPVDATLDVRANVADAVHVRVVDSVFSKNRNGAIEASAVNGATIDLDITRCRFEGNNTNRTSLRTTLSDDAAVAVSIADSLFVAKNAPAIEYFTSGLGGLPSLTLDVVGTTITNNRTGGIVGTVSGDGTTTVNLVNAIVWGNLCNASFCALFPTARDLYAAVEPGGAATLSVNADHVDVHDITLVGGAVFNDLGGNLDVAPEFVPGDRAYHLTPGSPLIDAGTNVGISGSDLDGDVRPSDGDGDTIAVADIGSDEFVP